MSQRKKKKRGALRYCFKYLLYPNSEERFNFKQAELLANSFAEMNSLVHDLRDRAPAYRKNALLRLKRYPDMLRDVISRIERIPEPPQIDKNIVRFKTSRGGELSPPAKITVFSGGAPGLGKR